MANAHRLLRHEPKGCGIALLGLHRACVFSALGQNGELALTAKNERSVWPAASSRQRIDGKRCGTRSGADTCADS